MKKFIRIAILFSIPVIILLSIPFYILFSSRENFFNIDSIINSPPDTKYLVGYIYNESTMQYLKYKTLKETYKHEIIALGSSRVLSFRKNMFRATFYNAGFVVESIKDFKPFMTSLPEDRYPEYLIIGLDQWMFHPDGMTWSALKESEFWTTNNSSSFSKGFKNFVTVYKDLFSGKIDFINHNSDTIGKIEYVGLNAVVYSQGIRNDGSYYYGNQIPKLLSHDTSAIDFEFRDTFRRIKAGNRRFDYADSVNDKALFILDDFLNFCKQKNIYVVGFLPPFADSVFAEMRKTGKYNYIYILSENLNPLFSKYGFEFFPFNSLADCNSNDSEAIDGFHGGEVSYLKLLIKMLENNSRLRNVCDLDNLKLNLSKSKNPQNAYGY